MTKFINQLETIHNTVVMYLDEKIFDSHEKGIQGKKVAPKLMVVKEGFMEEIPLC